jgi:2,5-diamino-6-(ribosylamino)-4(3H)-pyrimidinone 5'-phosphate reductase
MECPRARWGFHARLAGVWQGQDARRSCAAGPGGRCSGMARPRISTNLALSADGKISSSPPRPSGWTSPADHARLLELRENADAILVGRGTLESDRMTLTVPGRSAQPLRCIVSRTGEMDPEHPIFTKPGGAIHMLVTGELKGGETSGVTIHRGTLGEFLETLGTEYGVGRLHCEGGGQLIRALAELDAIDEFHVTLAGHTIFGGLDASTATGVPGDFLPKSPAFQVSHFESWPTEGECFLSYTRCR